MQKWWPRIYLVRSVLVFIILLKLVNSPNKGTIQKHFYGWFLWRCSKELNASHTTIVMFVTLLCWWLYDGDWFQMLMTESLFWRLFWLCWWFSQCITSVTNISNLSTTHLVSYLVTKIDVTSQTFMAYWTKFDWTMYRWKSYTILNKYDKLIKLMNLIKNSMNLKSLWKIYSVEWLDKVADRINLEIVQYWRSLQKSSHLEPPDFERDFLKCWSFKLWYVISFQFAPINRILCQQHRFYSIFDKILRVFTILYRRYILKWVF